MRLRSTLSFIPLLLSATPVLADTPAPLTEARLVAHHTIALQDRDGDGRISLKESAGAAVVLFQSIDGDHSASITASEMRSAAQADAISLNVSNRPDQADALVQTRFQMMDIDGDGSVSLPEMLAVMQTVFDAADSDGDGFVSEPELTGLAVLQSPTQPSRSTR